MKHSEQFFKSSYNRLIYNDLQKRNKEQLFTLFLTFPDFKNLIKLSQKRMNFKK